MRWVVGLLLVSAAVLKAWQLVTEPTVTIATGRLVLPLQIGVEFGIGLLALSGLCWRQLRCIALILFIGFAGYSLYLAMSGATSCACFGPIRVHPWWTFILDLAVVLGLLISFLRTWKEPTLDDERSDAQPFHDPYRRAMIAATTAAPVISVAALVWYIDRQTSVAEEGIGLSGQLAILEPEKWIGKQLPILNFIDLDPSSGDWTVLLHRHDCPACREAVPRFEQLAMIGQTVALIEVPPYGELAPRDGASHCGRLSDDREWFVQTPVEVRLHNGVVMAVRSHGH